MYYQEAAAAILVYDITKRETFDGITYWISELKARAPEGIKIAIAANKSDLVEQEAVNFSDAKKYADEHRAIFKMTSAKDGMGIQDLFLDIAAACGQATSATPTLTPVETAKSSSPSKGGEKTVKGTQLKPVDKKEEKKKKKCCQSQ
eukprot:TRINITY_DN3375_c0_g1_i2.p1 TRINITY_DN3375_c0_g1~~TRINITY_DN3375_c0_g1_i2.p1  ORF type:complete len:147 (-),score=34.19 TRINITY_DN3375_c0_g1_i2:111-551(-)